MDCNWRVVFQLPYLKSMIKNIFLLLFVLLSVYSFSQQTVHGVIIDSKTKDPIPFVNVSLPNSNRGTISNLKGNFSFMSNQRDSLPNLSFSHIGYHDLKLKVTDPASLITVLLEQKTNEIEEVMVMSENSLLKLLQSAYEKIPDNYSKTRTRYMGFFRESSKEETGNYLSYGEAFIESVRGSVTLKNDKGQIRILKSRGGFLPKADTTTHLHFYGGIFMSTQDFIQKRLSFIDPAHFNQYKYIIQKLDGYYKVSFTSKSERSGYSGYFILDPKNLAYLEAKYKSFGDLSLQLFYSPLLREYYDKFIEINDQYYLKYRNFNGSGLDKMSRKKIYHFNEYLSSEIFPNTEVTIPENEQFEYLDVFAERIPDYSKTYWEGYNIIEADSQFQKNQLLQPSQAEVINVLQKTNHMGRTIKVKIRNRLSVKYGFTFSNTLIQKGLYEIYIPEISQSFNKTLERINNLGLNSSVGYYVNKYLSVKYTETSGLGKENKYNEQLLGVELKKKINQFGIPNFISVGANFGLSTTLLKIGSFRNNEIVRWGGKELETKNIDAFIGCKSLVFKPEISFYRHLKGMSTIYINFSSPISIPRNDIIQLKEASGFIREKATVKVSKIGHSILKDQLPLDQFGMKTSIFVISLGINLNR